VEKFTRKRRSREMKKLTYITVKDYEEMKRLAKKYNLPPPSQIQATITNITEARDETKKEGR